nr:prepilin-type N-terminal cleavage/methylation domain-containing protein [Hydrogenophaga sp.]
MDRRHLSLHHALAPRCAQGFTLLELMIVVAIIALATAGVSLALRDSDSTLLEREALRLSALLESARAQSRTSGVPVLWRSTGSGFEFISVATTSGDPNGLANTRNWLSAGTRVQITQPAGAAVLVLGPEPLIAAQRLLLLQGDRRLSLGTDGLAPFAVLPESATP